MKRRVRFVAAIVLAFALGGCSSQQENENRLRKDLATLRRAIDKYTLDKEQAPQSLQDLVNKGYLKEIPTDPFTRKKDWVQQIGNEVLGPELTTFGLYDVHSNSAQVGSEGTAYNTW